MILRRLILISLLFAATSGHSEILIHATAESILNAFLATFAKEEVTWKKDIRLNETPGQLAPGRQLGQSVSVGYYSFIPKLWADFTPTEQTLLLRDPRLRAFILSARTASTFPLAQDGSARFPIEGVVLAPKETPSISDRTAATPGSQKTPVIIRVSPTDVMHGESLKVKVEK